MLACCPSCGDCSGGSPVGAWKHYKLVGLVTGGNYNTKQGCLPYTLPSCEHQYVYQIIIRNTILFFSINGSRPSVNYHFV
jgi:hypothetical protein